MLARQCLSFFVSPVSDNRNAHALFSQAFQRDCRDVARTQHHRTPTVERPEDFSSKLNCGRAHRCSASSYSCLLADAGANEARLLEKPIERSACRFAGSFPCLPNLSLDLGFTEYH